MGYAFAYGEPSNAFIGFGQFAAYNISATTGNDDVSFKHLDVRQVCVLSLC